MAWFDILAGVGQGLGQSAQDWQRQLLLKRERADQQKREEEERQRKLLAALQAQHAEAQSPLGGAQAETGETLAGERAAAAPVVRGERKVGRNEPCPCGSGRKYKQCHGALES